MVTVEWQTWTESVFRTVRANFCRAWRLAPRRLDTLMP